MSNCEETYREMTLEEEIEALKIDELVKIRLLDKASRIREECHKQEEYLGNCHYEIERLKSAIVEQAKIIGRLAEK